MKATLFVLSRPADDRDWAGFSVKDGEPLFVSAGYRWTIDLNKAICFLTAKAAQIHHGQLPWRLRERCAVDQWTIERCD